MEKLDYLVYDGNGYVIDVKSKNKNKVNWGRISEYQKLSEEFIEKFRDKIDWGWISEYQKLSEEFIEKFQDKVDWYGISINQKLSEEFIEKFQDKVDWGYISIYQKLSEEFITKHNLNIDKSKNTNYFNFEQKLELVKNTNLYEIVDEVYVIAYKSIRNDNYSFFNFQYCYEIGRIYEAHCDCNLDNEDSFGLSVWTREKALEYNSTGKLVKVKIHIDDIGAVVHDGGKLRCKKFEVIEEVK